MEYCTPLRKHYRNGFVQATVLIKFQTQNDQSSAGQYKTLIKCILRFDKDIEVAITENKNNWICFKMTNSEYWSGEKTLSNLCELKNK